jgi:hypothetical protein
VTAKPPKPKKKRRLRKVVMLASVIAAVVGYRERKMSDNEASPRQP